MSLVISFHCSTFLPLDTRFIYECSWDPFWTLRIQLIELQKSAIVQWYTFKIIDMMGILDIKNCIYCVFLLVLGTLIRETSFSSSEHKHVTSWSSKRIG